jgi:hypothetical protein
MILVARDFSHSLFFDMMNGGCCCLT